MQRVAVVLVAVAALVGGRTATAHCQIPCGIYDDMLRIQMLLEDVQTIDKSIASIRSLAGKNDPTDLNQLVRWIENKDEHADHLGEVVTEYFLRQRIKRPSGDDLSARARYVEQLEVLHGLLVISMKAKQTVDPQVPAAIRELVERFKKAYFTEEELAHVRDHG